MTYWNSETGAVTVDWVVLTAGLVGLGLATMSVVSTGVQDTSQDIQDQLQTSIISSSFAVDYSYEAWEPIPGVSGSNGRLHGIWTLTSNNSMEQSLQDRRDVETQFYVMIAAMETHPDLARAQLDTQMMYFAAYEDGLRWTQENVPAEDIIGAVPTDDPGISDFAVLNEAYQTAIQ